MTYALKKVSSVLIKKQSWEAFEAHVCHIALAYPNTLQVVARIFCTYDNVGYPLSRPRIERLLNAIIEHHAPLEHHSEVAWALWLTRTLGTNITKSNVERVSNVHSSACALLLMDLDTNGRLPARPLTNLWHTLMFPEELNVTFTSGVWTLNDALVGTSTSDPKTGLKSLRVRNGIVTMTFDWPKGAQTVSVNHAKYGTDASSTWTLYHSTDGGSTWTPAGPPVTSSTTTLTPATFTLNIPGPIRFEFRKVGGTTTRFNLDDFQISGY